MNLLLDPSGAACRPPTATTMPAAANWALARDSFRTHPRMKNRVQLICYADRLGGTLRGLRELLAGPLAACSAACTSCRSSTPSTARTPASIPSTTRRSTSAWATGTTCAPSRGDVGRDGRRDRQSRLEPVAAVPGLRRARRRSRFAGLFLTLDGVFPDGATEHDLLAIYRPRPGLPFTPMTLADGTRRHLWTTFTPEQIDIDVAHPRRQRVPGRHPATSRRATACKMIRLDAVGYAIKKAGTSCFMMAETFDFIARVRRTCAPLRPGGAGRNPFALPAADRDRAPRGLGLRLRAAAARAACFLDGTAHVAEALDRDTPAQRAHRARHARRHRRHRHRRRQAETGHGQGSCRTTSSTISSKRSTRAAAARACAPRARRRRTSISTR